MAPVIQIDQGWAELLRRDPTEPVTVARIDCFTVRGRLRDLSADVLVSQSEVFTETRSLVRGHTCPDSLVSSVRRAGSLGSIVLKYRIGVDLDEQESAIRQNPTCADL